MAGFASLAPSNSTSGGSYDYGMRSDPSANIRGAAAGARGAMNTLGVPDFGTLLKQFGGMGTTEFGNAGVAGQGAAFERGQLNDWRSNLTNLSGQIAAREKAGVGPNVWGGQLSRDRAEYANPTNSPAFKAAMGLAGETTAASAQQAQRDAMEASARRGYFAGADPRSSDITRMQALSEAGFAGVKDIRDQALAKYGTDQSGYSAEQAANQSRYNTDLGSLTSLYNSGMSGYNSANAGFTQLTDTQAGLPTKMLTALGGLGGLLGGPEGFFHDALGEYDSSRAFNAAARNNDAAQGFASTSRRMG